MNEQLPSRDPATAVRSIRQCIIFLGVCSLVPALIVAWNHFFTDVPTDVLEVVASAILAVGALAFLVRSWLRLNHRNLDVESDALQRELGFWSGASCLVVAFGLLIAASFVLIVGIYLWLLFRGS